MNVLEEIEFKLRNIPPDLKDYDREDYKNRLYAKRSRIKKKMKRLAPEYSELLEMEIKMALLIQKTLEGRPTSEIDTRQARIIIARHGSEEAKRLSGLVAKF